MKNDDKQKSESEMKKHSEKQMQQKQRQPTRQVPLPKGEQLEQALQGKTTTPQNPTQPALSPRLQLNKNNFVTAENKPDVYQTLMWSWLVQPLLQRVCGCSVADKPFYLST
eukprot:4841153-Amphidinium_carterae.2